MPTIMITSGPNNGHLYTIDSDKTIMGRGDSCSIQLVDEKASRQHCCIERKAGDTMGGTGIPVTLYMLQDLGSSNGTTLDGVKIADHARLHDGNIIGIGTSNAAFLIDEFDDAAKAKAHLESLGKGGTQDGDDAWPLDPPWKTQTLAE
tara:strand:- start:9439 stop:9882 length:444 start_codon:yes stop_codon:yes gene_type:complete